MVAQVALGGATPEIGLYLQTIFGLQLVDCLLFALLGCAADTPEVEPGPSSATLSTNPSSAQPTSPTYEADQGSPESTRIVRPDLSPDERTLYMTRGGLPSPLIAETEVSQASVMTAEIYCQGSGSFRMKARLDGTGSLAPIPEISCGESPDGGSASVALGAVDAGTSVVFTFEGSAGVQFLVRVQLDRAIE